MYCPNCGAPAKTAAKYCTQCGVALDSTMPTGSAEQSSAPTGSVQEQSGTSSKEETQDSRVDNPSDGYTSAAQPPKWAPKTALYYATAAILAAIGVGLFWYAFTKTGVNASDKIPFLIGYYFWVPVVCYLVWRSSLKRRKGAGTLLGAIAFVAIALYQSHAMIQQSTAEKHAIKDVRALMLGLMNGKVISASRLRDSGQYRSALLLIRDFDLRITNDLKGYTNQLKSSHMGAMLRHANFESSSNIDKSLDALDKIKSALNRAQTKVMAEYNNVPTLIQAANNQDNAGSSMDNGFLKGIKHGKAAAKEYFGIEHKIIHATRGLLQFMKARQGFFVVQNDKVMFARHADLVTYDGYIHRIRQGAEQESDLRKRQKQYLEKGLKKLSKPQQ